MLFTMSNVRGDVLMNEKDFKILKIKSSDLSGNLPSKDPDSLPRFVNIDIPKFTWLRQFPDHPLFILVKDSQILTIDNLTKIEEEISVKSKEHPLNEFNSIVSRYKNKDKAIDTTELFTFLKNDSKYTYNKQDYTLDISGEEFALNIKDVSKNTTKTTNLLFSNPVETIIMPIEGIEKYETKIINRMNIPGRMFPYYEVHGISETDSSKLRKQISYKIIPQLTIEGMMRFFGTRKRNATKVETLSECLKTLAIKYADTKEKINKAYHLKITAINRNISSGLDMMPMDWILTHAANMKIISTYSKDPTSTEIFASIVENTTDDIAQMMYTVLETSPIAISAFDGDLIDNVINSLTFNNNTKKEQA